MFRLLGFGSRSECFRNRLNINRFVKHRIRATLQRLSFCQSGEISRTQDRP